MDREKLVDWCRLQGGCALVAVRPGDFVLPGSPLLFLYGVEAAAVASAERELLAHFALGPVRTDLQDPEYPITQIDQMAARALSPGVNDPGTAIGCIDALLAAFARVIDRDLPGPVYCDADGVPRLLARSVDLAGLFKAAFAPLRQFARDDVAVTLRLFEAFGVLAEHTVRPDRLALLAAQGRALAGEVADAPLVAPDRRDLVRRARRLVRLTGEPFRGFGMD